MKRPRRRRRRSAVSNRAWYGFTMLAAIAVFVIVVSWPASKSLKAVAAPSEPTFQCAVSGITDGDTLRCADGSRIRLHAVAARESDETCSVGHPCPTASAAAATAKLTELASGQTLRCSAIGKSYERITAICRNQSNIEINCAMIQSGTAVIWPKFNEQKPICR